MLKRSLKLYYKEKKKFKAEKFDDVLGILSGLSINGERSLHHREDILVLIQFISSFSLYL